MIRDWRVLQAVMTIPDVCLFIAWFMYVSIYVTFYMSLTGLAYMIRDWRVLQAIMAIPDVCLFIAWFMYVSIYPPFYMSLTGLAYMIRDWRVLQAVMTIPDVCLFIVWFLYVATHISSFVQLFCPYTSFPITTTWKINQPIFIFLVDNCPFVGPLVPLFWISGDVPSGFQSQSGLPYSHCGGKHNVCSLRSTSCATHC